jgi:hypothetical protein
MRKRIKTDELTGVELNYYVAKAEGIIDNDFDFLTFKKYNPPCGWNIIGPLADKYDLFCCGKREREDKKYCMVLHFNGKDFSAKDQNLLTAIKRGIVKIKFGETVEINE